MIRVINVLKLQGIIGYQYAAESRIEIKLNKRDILFIYIYT